MCTWITLFIYVVIFWAFIGESAPVKSSCQMWWSSYKVGYNVFLWIIWSKSNVKYLKIVLEYILATPVTEFLLGTEFVYICHLWRFSWLTSRPAWRRSAPEWRDSDRARVSARAHFSWARSWEADHAPADLRQNRVPLSSVRTGPVWQHGAGGVAENKKAAAEKVKRRKITLSGQCGVFEPRTWPRSLKTFTARAGNG